MAGTRLKVADLELIEAAAREAGDLALRYFRRNPTVWSKQGGSPVTEADFAVDGFLRSRLLTERPDYGWLSEETTDDLARCAREMVFVVDPIDGTRSFVEGSAFWCVSIAVVKAGRPVVAALNAPALGELYTASVGGGAETGGRRIAVSERGELTGARISGPRGWVKAEAIIASGALPQMHVSSLAYRLASVAADRLDAAFASPRAHDWDLAASDLLVHEAGGRLTGLDGLPPRYNQQIPRHDVLAASNARIHAEVLAAVEAARREVARGSKNRGSSKGF